MSAARLRLLTKAVCASAAHTAFLMLFFSRGLTRKQEAYISYQRSLLMATERNPFMTVENIKALLDACYQAKSCQKPTTHSFSRSLHRCWQTSRTTMPPARSARLKSSTASCQRGELPLHTNKADFTQGTILKKAIARHASDPRRVDPASGLRRS